MRKTALQTFWYFFSRGQNTFWGYIQNISFFPHCLLLHNKNHNIPSVGSLVQSPPCRWLLQTPQFGKDVGTLSLLWGLPPPMNNSRLLMSASKCSQGCSTALFSIWRIWCKRWCIFFSWSVCYHLKYVVMNFKWEHNKLNWGVPRHLSWEQLEHYGKHFSNLNAIVH